MNQQEHHQMTLEATHSSGAEEWYCPTCGRRFLMEWPPAYRKIVLDPGDEYAIHSGNKGGLAIGCEILPATTAPELEEPSNDLDIASSAEAHEDEDTPLTDELRPWLNWLKGTNLDDRRDEGDQQI
jgi:hypothetical protein